MGKEGKTITAFKITRAGKEPEVEEVTGSDLVRQARTVHPDEADAETRAVARESRNASLADVADAAGDLGTLNEFISDSDTSETK